jgi:hypothetical protein
MNPAVMPMLVPRTNTNAGTSANPMARHGQRILFAGVFEKTIPPKPLAKTSNTAAWPIVFGFQVVKAAALFNS